MMIRHKITIVLMKVAGYAHFIYDQLNSSRIRLYSQLRRNDLSACLHQSIKYKSAPTQQIFIPVGFIVGAVRLTQFLNQRLIFTHFTIITKFLRRCYNTLMSYFLARQAVLKWLETPSIYHIGKDELYELDTESFRFLKNCALKNGCSFKDSAFTDYCLDEGLLTTEVNILQRPPLIQSPNPSLRYLEIQITDACNLQCRHCYIDSTRPRELSFERIRDLLKEFADMQGLRVLITGGEPLIHSHFNEINELLPDYFLRKVLLTNGLLVTQNLLKTLKVDEIQVSIDGLERAHDSVRGSGTYKRSMDAVKLALDAGFMVSISTMVHRANFGDFDEMERLFHSMGIRDWTVDVPCVTGRLKENADLQVAPEEGGRYLGYGYGGGLHAAAQGFGCGYHLMSVMADGNIAKCTFYHERSVGTIRDGLREAWKKIQPVQIKEISCNCDFIDICRGGCRYRAELINGKGGKDLYRCTLYGII